MFFHEKHTMDTNDIKGVNRNSVFLDIFEQLYIDVSFSISIIKTSY